LVTALPRAAHGLRHFLVREPELVDEAPEARRLLDRVQVLALDVLDQADAPRAASVGHLAHQGRKALQPRDLRGAPAALAARIS